MQHGRAATVSPGLPLRVPGVPMLPPRNSHMSASGTSAGSKLWGGMLTSLVSRVGVIVICTEVEATLHALSSASPSSDWTSPPPSVHADWHCMFQHAAAEEVFYRATILTKSCACSNWTDCMHCSGGQNPPLSSPYHQACWQDFRELGALLGRAAHLPVLIWGDVPIRSDAVLCLLRCPCLAPRGRSCRQQRYTGEICTCR